MSHDDPTLDYLQAIARPLIRSKVRRLIGKGGLRGQDHEDLEQELWSKMWPRLRSYNAARGRSHGFLATMIDRIVVNLLRDRYAHKRDFRRVSSLRQKVLTEEGEQERGDTLSQHEQDACHGRSPRSDIERADLVRDMAEVIQQLPKDKQQLAEDLKKYTPSEIARRRGVPRSTLQAQVRQLREIFDHAGLRDYL